MSEKAAMMTDAEIEAVNSESSDYCGKLGRIREQAKLANVLSAQLDAKDALIRAGEETITMQMRHRINPTPTSQDEMERAYDAYQSLRKP